MKTKDILTALLLAAVAGATASIFLIGRGSVEKPITQTGVASAPIQNLPPTSVAEVVTISAPEKIAAMPATPKKPAAKAGFQKQNAGNSANPKKEIQDPDARVALSLVGADPEAEQYWMAAINNPSLSANERKDLIEDLNEDGLSDPKHPGAQDLPLILGRIQLIEQLAPASMDQVNADAFQEAYKDLVNLALGGTAQ